MIEEYVEKTWNLLKEFKRVTPELIARKFKIDLEFAQKVCQKVWIRQHKEARIAAAELENYGFDPQMQRVAKRNIEKFKKKESVM